MSEGRILFCDIFPETPASTCTNFCISVRCMILIAIDGSLCTASVCHKYKVVFCKNNSLFYAIHLTLDCFCNLLIAFKLKEYVCNLCIELEFNTCFFQIFLHWQDQRFILIIFCKFKSTEIRKSGNMMDKSLEIQFHFQCAVPVLKCEHSSPV